MNTNSVDVRGEAKALLLHCICDGEVAAFTSPAKIAMEDLALSNDNIAINGLRSALLATCCVGVCELFL